MLETPKAPSNKTHQATSAPVNFLPFASLLISACLHRPPAPATPTQECKALQSVGGVTVKEGQTQVASFSVCAEHRYTACTIDSEGNPDLSMGPLNPLFPSLLKSRDGDQVSYNGGKPQPRPDCISFVADATGEAQLNIEGGPNAAVSSKTSVWIAATPLGIPKEFEHTLEPFSETCTETTGPYGNFGAPWGNEGKLHRPFYNDSPNYIHGGTDYKCEAGRVIRASCDGTIVSSNNAGEGWGWDTTEECTIHGHTLSIAVIHLTEDSVNEPGTFVRAGQPLGRVFPVEVEDEPIHFHVSMCEGTDAESRALHFPADRGAWRWSEHATAIELCINPDDPRLYK